MSTAKEKIFYNLYESANDSEVGEIQLTERTLQEGKTTEELLTMFLESLVDISSIETFISNTFRVNNTYKDHICKLIETVIDDIDDKKLKEFVCEATERIDYGFENESLMLLESKDKFNKQKNKLITLITKNDNVAKKLKRRKILALLFYVLVALYCFGMFYIFTQGLDNPIMGNMEILGQLSASHKKQIISTTIISISVFMLFVFVSIDMYQRLSQKHYEHFNELIVNPPIETCSLHKNADTQDYDTLTQYLSKVLQISVYHESLQHQNDVKRAHIIESILNDFDNINYVNMRKYQITNYEINYSKSQISHIKYAFFIVSCIGLLAGFYLREVVPLDLLIATTVALVLIYLTVIIFRLKHNKIRKKYNWNKIYWNLKATR